MGDQWPSNGIWAELFPLVRELGNSLDLGETLQTLDRGLRDLLGFDAIAVYRPAGETVVTEYAGGPDAGEFSLARPDRASGLSTRVALEHRSVRNADPASDGLAADSPLRSALAVPLMVRGELAGVLTLYRRGECAFSPRDSSILEELAPKIAASLSNAILFGRWEESGSTDAAVGRISNQRSLLKRLGAEMSRCRRNDTTLAVVSCRPHVPSKILDTIGRRFRDSCRDHDTVAALGMELVLLLPHMLRDHIAGKIRRLHALVEAEVPGAEVQTGTAFYPGDGERPEEILKAARERVRV